MTNSKSRNRIGYAIEAQDRFGSPLRQHWTLHRMKAAVTFLNWAIFSDAKKVKIYRISKKNWDSLK